MFAADIKAVPPGAMNHQPAQSWRTIIQPVEPFLDTVNQRLAREVESFDPGLAGYAEYALTGQGKHLRPALVVLTANALGKLEESHATAAVIIEMVHLATLVHDDIMDEAEIRRGRLTLAANWGNEIAVLFGDCLFARALELAAGFPTTDVCRAIAASTNTVCTGEVLQTQRRGDFRFTRTDYLRVLEMKTGELFAVSCELSAFLCGSTKTEQAALRSFGMAFGTAYQIYDDCVDLFGSEEMAGKSLGTDLAKGKLTLPMLLLWERASAEDRERVQQMLKNWDASLMGHVGELLAKYDTLPTSLEIMRQILGEARRALDLIGNEAGRAGLGRLTEYLTRQTGALGYLPGSSV